MNIRVGRAARAKIKITTKLRINSAVVTTALLYRLETWATTRQQEQQIDAFDTTCLCSILNIRWWHRTRNTEVREKPQRSYAALIMKRNRLQCFVLGCLDPNSYEYGMI